MHNNNKPVQSSIFMIKQQQNKTKTSSTTYNTIQVYHNVTSLDNEENLYDKVASQI